MLPGLAKYHFRWGNNCGAYIAAGPFIRALLNVKNIRRGFRIIYSDEKKDPTYNSRSTTIQ
jgi:hypothetical protein